jgi:hypothetical protein
MRGRLSRRWEYQLKNQPLFVWFRNIYRSTIPFQQPIMVDFHTAVGGEFAPQQVPKAPFQAQAPGFAHAARDGYWLAATH